MLTNYVKYGWDITKKDAYDVLKEKNFEQYVKNVWNDSENTTITTTTMPSISHILGPDEGPDSYMNYVKTPKQRTDLSNLYSFNRSNQVDSSFYTLSTLIQLNIIRHLNITIHRYQLNLMIR